MQKEYELLPCPFCGAVPVIREGVAGRGSNRKGILPKGATLERETQFCGGSGSVYFYYYVGYQITCETPKCYCNGTLPYLKSLDETVKRWNTRQGISAKSR